MKKYRCHKIVEAGKITRIARILLIGTNSILTLEGGETVEVSSGWMQKHTPKVRGYFVRYEDGYESYSPAKAFKAGYTEIK
jgi:hypothetical protein